MDLDVDVVRDPVSWYRVACVIPEEVLLCYPSISLYIYLSIYLALLHEPLGIAQPYRLHLPQTGLT